MPTYEYECQECKHRFEAFQGITAEPLKECPKCNGQLQRLISGGGGIIFSAKSRSAFGGKGSGFYATDYKNKKRNLSDGRHKETACPLDKNKPACDSCSSNDRQ